MEKAIRKEANQAVAHWWGVTPQTVSKWRKALDVGMATEGTSQPHGRHTAGERGEAMRAVAIHKARDSERLRNIAEARRGKPRPPHVGQAVAEAHRGTRHSAKARRKMSETHRRRGILVPGTILWTREEDELVQTLPIREAMRRTGRTLSAVKTRRLRLGVPDGRMERTRWP